MVVIFSGILIFVTSYLGFIPEFIGTELEGWVYFYNETMLFISQFKIATVDNLYLKPHLVFLIVLCLIVLIRFIETRKFYLYRIFTISLLIISGLVLFDHHQKSTQKKIVLYDVKGKSYFDAFLVVSVFQMLIQTMKMYYSI